MGLLDQIGNALKNGNVKYTGGSANNVNITLGNGDSTVLVKGSTVNVTTGTGNQRVEIEGGTDVNVKLDQNADPSWDFSGDFDRVAVVGVADKGKVNIDTGDGGGITMAVAKNVTINEGDAVSGQQQVTAVWGETATITSGNGGEKYDTTFDQAAANGVLDNFVKPSFSADIVTAADNAFTDTLTTGEAKRIEHTLVATETNKESFMNKVQKQYNLDSTQMGIIEKLFDSGELFKELRDGVPQYAILQSATQKDANGNPKYVLTKIDTYNESTGYIHGWGYGYASNVSNPHAVNDFKDCIKTDTKGEGSDKLSVLEQYYIETTQIFDDTYRQDITVNGMKSYTKTAGESEYDYTSITIANGGKTNIEAGDSDKHYAKVDGSYTVDIKYTNEKSEETTGSVWGVLEQTGTTRKSPLVLDMNHDGKVSATSAFGIDVNGDGKIDGAATGGDKMLAMSDLSGNKKIDGAEVFGDQTVSPFTGEKLNAENGFEALKQIASQAEKYTGIKCYYNGEVDLAALKNALATVGVNIGYISDNNTTELEALENYDVAKIAVDNYKEVDDTGDVQHRQQGSYTTADGTEYSIDDVWFTEKRIKS